MEDKYKEPTVVSFVENFKIKNENLRGQKIAESFTLALTEIAQIAQTKNFLVGHIKALVKTDAGSFRLSVVKGEAKLQDINFNFQTPILFLELALTAIVYGVLTEDLTNLIKLSLKKYLSADLIINY